MDTDKELRIRHMDSSSMPTSFKLAPRILFLKTTFIEPTARYWYPSSILSSIGYCLGLYDAMDNAAKIGLQFVFPADLTSSSSWLSLHCGLPLYHLQRRSSQQPSARHYYHMLCDLVGQRAVRCYLHLSFCHILNC